LPTKRSEGPYSLVGSFGCDEYSALNIDNEKTFHRTQAKRLQHSSEGKI